MTSKNDSAITDQVHKNLDALFGEDDEAPDDTPAEENLPDEQPVNQALDNRLDTFFENEDMPNTKSENEMVAKHADIENLKSVILSLEWEITDQVMQKLGEEIRLLEEKRKDDKIIVAFLQLLGSLGKYIRKKRAEAHPDSIRLLHSVYENVEEIISSDTIDDGDKKKMLLTQVGEYKKLKQDIMVSSPPPSESPAPKEPDTKKTGESEDRASQEPLTTASSESGAAFQGKGRTGDTISNQEALQIAEAILSTVQEIHKTIQSEFKALREDLHQWQENNRN